MHITSVRYHVLRNISADKLEDYCSGGPYRNLRLDPVVRDNWISFTALDWDKKNHLLYIGLTAFDRDIVYRFHPDTAEFESLRFHDVSDDPLHVKIHRGLTPDGEGGYYFGTAGLLDLDERNDAIGGGVYHYQDGTFVKLGVPVPHDYIQSIAVDKERERVYGVTFPVVSFFDFDMKTAKTQFQMYTGSAFHSPGIDDDGYVWGTYQGRNGHCLYRYHADEGNPHFFHTPIPNLGPDHLFNYPLNGPIDSFVNTGDGFLYFGTTLGDLYRLQPDTGQMELLGKPTKQMRMAALRIGPGGHLLGSYGAYNETGLFVYDRSLGKFHDLGKIRDDRHSCFMIHDIAWDGGERVFVGETDNVDRSGFLWEATLG